MPHLTSPLVVLGIPRGGVPVAAEVADALAAPLDVIVVRKLGCPGREELGLGAIGEGGTRVVNSPLIDRLGVGGRELAGVEAVERVELERRVRAYRGDVPAVSLRGATAVIVDDGIATGSTARAACAIARARGAERVVLAAPVAPPHAVRDLAADPAIDAVVVPRQPTEFMSIGEFYDDFAQVGDAEVTAILQGRRRRIDTEVAIDVDGRILRGILAVPAGARSLVVFAHGSGSSRLSPRNALVASRLRDAGHATLLFDLLTDSEAAHRESVFDIRLLAARLQAVAEWARVAVPGLPIAYFGASTGAAAALWAAADDGVIGVVSRGGRPDLAATRLADVRCPVLLIVGGRDEDVLELNARARAVMTVPCDLEIVPGAGHLFEEPGALDAVAVAACDWLRRYAGASPAT